MKYKPEDVVEILNFLEQNTHKPLMVRLLVEDQQTRFAINDLERLSNSFYCFVSPPDETKDDQMLKAIGDALKDPFFETDKNRFGE